MYVFVCLGVIEGDDLTATEPEAPTLVRNGNGSKTCIVPKKTIWKAAAS